MKTTIANEVKSKLSKLQLGIIQFKTENSQLNELLWEKIASLQKALQDQMEVAQISQLPAIHYGRKAYKTLGKDPARYRLSAEALMRRTLKGSDLYQISTMVDFINYISLKTGISIGGYDQDRIEGDIYLSIGTVFDEYNAVGRGKLNIEYLPVLRDQKGAFGSPTSDSVRTSIQLRSNTLILVFFDFEFRPDLKNLLQEIVEEAHEIFSFSDYNISIAN